MLHSLKKITSAKSKRVGRGVGSGKGAHTVGRGSKGHTAREGGIIPLWFEGGQLPLIKRLPYMRGKYHFKSLRSKPTAIPLSKLQVLAGGEVTMETLVAAKIIKSLQTRVKIVAGGTAPKLKEVRGIALSASARKVLEDAGVTIHD